MEAIHALMDKIKTDLDAGAVPLNKFIITKQLTRSPTEYPDAKSQPHVQVRCLLRQSDGIVTSSSRVIYVPPHASTITLRQQSLPPHMPFMCHHTPPQSHYANNPRHARCRTASPTATRAQVALRRLAAGKRGGVAAGETVPYIIAVPVDPETGAPRPEPSTGLAQKARHPEELREKEGTSEPLGIDVHYYLSNQVHPVVSRLCAHIEGTDAGHIAHFLGLESSKFRAAPEETIYRSVFVVCKPSVLCACTSEPWQIIVVRRTPATQHPWGDLSRAPVTSTPPHRVPAAGMT